MPSNINNFFITKQIAEKYQVSSSLVLLRWALQKGTIMIPRSSNTEHITENIQVFNFSLNNEDINTIDSMDENIRYCWDSSDVS